MVDVNEFKSEISKIISQIYGIEFLGKNFDIVVNLMTDSNAEKIYYWVSFVVNKKIPPIIINSKKGYKEWVLKQLLVFRYPLNIAGTEYRIMFVKVKNSFYIEFHLGDHKYYDKFRKDFGLKKRNY